MNAEYLYNLIPLKRYEDYETIPSKEFEDLVYNSLLSFPFLKKIERQVIVKNRGDGNRGKVDLVLHMDNGPIPIEIDRKSPREKSIFKVTNFPGKHFAFIITRSPFVIFEY